MASSLRQALLWIAPGLLSLAWAACVDADQCLDGQDDARCSEILGAAAVCQQNVCVGLSTVDASPPSSSNGDGDVVASSSGGGGSTSGGGTSGFAPASSSGELMSSSSGGSGNAPPPMGHDCVWYVNGAGYVTGERVGANVQSVGMPHGDGTVTLQPAKTDGRWWFELIRPIISQFQIMYEGQLASGVALDCQESGDCYASNQPLALTLAPETVYRFELTATPDLDSHGLVIRTGGEQLASVNMPSGAYSLKFISGEYTVRTVGEDANGFRSWCTSEQQVISIEPPDAGPPDSSEAVQ